MPDGCVSHKTQACVWNFVPEQQALASQITEPAHTAWSLSSQKEVFFFLSLMPANRNKGSTRGGAGELQRCHWSAFATTRPAFFPQRGWGGGETECRAAGYQQQRELKQRFLINPENVESKSSAHVVKISQGWAATGMIAFPEQGHYFLLLNTGVRRTIISLLINPRTI